MIATGGLLRINARRQDSVRSTTRKHNTHPKKNKRQRDLVVVKGKLRLCSVSGLVAGLGILILLLGALMAVLGYWPAENMLFSSPTAESTQDRATYNNTSTNTSNTSANISTASAQRRESLNRPVGVLEVFLNRYLYSDRLKVIGPLIMGGGIFLFICANAVLHETRDKKTKVIDLRDVYSTVVDLHGLQTSNPINGLHGYIQSKPSAGLSALPLAELGGEGGDSDTVFSIDPIWLPNPDHGFNTNPSPRPNPKPSCSFNPNLNTNINPSCNCDLDPSTNHNPSPGCNPIPCSSHPNPNPVCEPILNLVAPPCHTAPLPPDGNLPGGSGGLQGRPVSYSPVSQPQVVSSKLPKPFRTNSREMSCSSSSLLLLFSSSSPTPLLTPGEQSRRRSFPGGSMTGCTKLAQGMGVGESGVTVNTGQHIRREEERRNKSS